MDANGIGLTVNGDQMVLEEGGSLRDVVRAYGLDPDGVRGVAVALNDEVIRREAWDATPVGAGDRVEIVTALQGG